MADDVPAMPPPIIPPPIMPPPIPGVVAIIAAMASSGDVGSQSSRQQEELAVGQPFRFGRVDHQRAEQPAIELQADVRVVEVRAWHVRVELVDEAAPGWSLAPA